MLPQPYVVVAQGKVDGLRVALDLTQEWDKLNNGSRLITAGLLVRKAFLDENPQAVADFLTEYAASVDYVNKNVDEAAQLVEKYDIVKAAVAKAAIPYCNIVCITGDEMKTDVQGYLGILYGQNPKAVGGALPADDFYYMRKTVGCSRRIAFSRSLGVLSGQRSSSSCVVTKYTSRLRLLCREGNATSRASAVSQIAPTMSRTVRFR